MAEHNEPYRKGIASITDQPVDRLYGLPDGMGVTGRTAATPTTYQEWASDPKKFAAGIRRGAEVLRLRLGHRPDGLSVWPATWARRSEWTSRTRRSSPIRAFKTVEDYEKLRGPGRAEGKMRRHCRGNEALRRRTEEPVVCAGFIEGPLLALTQSTGAEKVFMDMYNHRSAMHKALTKMTEFDKNLIDGFKETGCAGLAWDYLWGSYSCLGDKEYEEFEGNDKYAVKLNAHTSARPAWRTAYTTAPTCRT